MVIAVGNDQGILGLNPTFAEIVLFNSSNWTRNFEKKQLNSLWISGVKPPQTNNILSSIEKITCY